MCYISKKSHFFFKRRKTQKISWKKIRNLAVCSLGVEAEYRVLIGRMWVRFPPTSWALYRKTFHCWHHFNLTRRNINRNITGRMTRMAVNICTFHIVNEHFLCTLHNPIITILLWKWILSAFRYMKHFIYENVFPIGTQNTTLGHWFMFEMHE